MAMVNTLPTNTRQTTDYLSPTT